MTDETEKLERTLHDVLSLFGDSGWPRIEVRTDVEGSSLCEKGTYSATLPLRDEDADKIRKGRRLLEDLSRNRESTETV